MRSINRIVSAIVALSIIACCVVIVAESVSALIDQGPLLVPLDGWDRWWSDRTWSDDVTTTILIAVGVVGLVLLLFESWRRRPEVLDLAPGDEATRSAQGERRVVIGRRGLENHMRTIVEREVGVLSASTRAHRRKISVDLTTSSTNKDLKALRKRVKIASAHGLDELHLDRELRVDVDVTRAKQRVR